MSTTSDNGAPHSLPELPYDYAALNEGKAFKTADGAVLDVVDVLRKHLGWLRGVPQGRRADLRGAYLRGAYLRGADLRGADLSGAYLRGAYLRGAYLSGAYLRGAYLRGADGQEVRLSDELLAILRTERITLQELTTWGACSSGMSWVMSTLGDSVSCSDLFAHGKDEWQDWLFTRILNKHFPPITEEEREALREQIKAEAVAK